MDRPNASWAKRKTETLVKSEKNNNAKSTRDRVNSNISAGAIRGYRIEVYPSGEHRIQLATNSDRLSCLANLYYTGIGVSPSRSKSV